MQSAPHEGLEQILVGKRIVALDKPQSVRSREALHCATFLASVLLGCSTGERTPVASRTTFAFVDAEGHPVGAVDVRKCVSSDRNFSIKKARTFDEVSDKCTSILNVETEGDLCALGKELAVALDVSNLYLLTSASVMDAHFEGNRLSSTIAVLDRRGIVLSYLPKGNVKRYCTEIDGNHIVLRRASHLQP